MSVSEVGALMYNYTVKRFLKNRIAACALLVMTILISQTACSGFSAGDTEDPSVPQVDGAGASMEQNTSPNAQKYYLGSAVNTGKNNGYSESNTIELNDPHYGWTLGRFFVSDYTRIIDDGTNDLVFLKTLDDKIALGFMLEQGIDSLNGNEKLTITDDKKGYDKGFQIEKSNFGRGTLIAKHIDYQNKEGVPQIFTDYLPAMVVGADTVIQLCEEGDYEIALDYKIKNKKGILSSYTDYRIFIKFSVRNGNCMVYPYDVSTETELPNNAITENGFYLDLAKSRYLDIDIKREVLIEGAEGLVEDTRFNRPAKDGDEYTEEGIYTITVSNRYTGERTKKQIYVGTNDSFNAYISKGLPLEEFEEPVSPGAQITDEGGSVSSPESFSDGSFSDEPALTSVLIETLKAVDIKIWIAAIFVVLLIIIIFLIVLVNKRTPHKRKRSAANEEGK